MCQQSPAFRDMLQRSSDIQPDSRRRYQQRNRGTHALYIGELAQQRMPETDLHAVTEVITVSMAGRMDGMYMSACMIMVITMQVHVRTEQLRTQYRHCDQGQQGPCECAAAESNFHGALFILQPTIMSKQPPIMRSLLLALLALTGTATLVEKLKHLSVELLWQIERLGAPVISPVGGHIVRDWPARFAPDCRHVTLRP